MTSQYSIAEARANLAKILDEVERGRGVELTRRGKPVAMLVSVEEYHRLANGKSSFAEAYEGHRARFRGLEPSDLADLRDADRGREVSL